MLAFAVGAAIDWFWEIAALGAIFFLAAGVARRRPLRPARRRRRVAEATRTAESAASASPSPAWRSPGSRRWRWSGRCWSTARSTPARAPPADGDLGQRRRPRRHGPLDRALGRLALRPARPARRAPGRLRRPRSTASARRSTARTATGSLLPALAGRARGRRTRPRPRPTSSRRAQLNPLDECLRGKGLRMSAG